MKCPTCSIELKMTDRQGIEIDYCPQCRGVWLDRGELDKIIERSTQGPKEYEEPRSEGYRHPKHKRKSLLKDLFDF
jgi:Zn-finger nucleic acid-binding protein